MLRSVMGAPNREMALMVHVPETGRLAVDLAWFAGTASGISSPGVLTCGG